MGKSVSSFSCGKRVLALARCGPNIVDFIEVDPSQFNSYPLPIEIPNLYLNNIMDPKKITVKDIPSLSDHGLRDALKVYDQNPGPITDSTRNIYKKKLAALLQDQNLEDDDDSSDEDFVIQEDEEITDDEEEDEDEEDLSELDEKEKEELLKDLERDVTLNLAERSSTSRSIKIAISVFILTLASLYNFRDKMPVQRTIVLSFFALILYCLYKVLGFFRNRTRRHRERVHSMVNEALELLQSPENPKGMMPVLHIRDTLLTPAERNSKKAIQLWNECVKFVEQHESRVKVEIVNVEGEDFRAWKWIGTRK